MNFIAIGGNLAAPDGTLPLQLCTDAAYRLDGICGLRLVAVSPWFTSAAVPPSAQPDYINGVAALAGDAVPEQLLAALQALERAAGRTRGVANAARTLDLDIAAMGGLVRHAPDPVVPHPRMHLRAFVLAPLAAIAPDWVHPLLGKTAACLLAGLSAGGIRQLPSQLR